jgi:hypothetical protein
MKGEVRNFFAGAFALIALFLIVAHAGGFAQAIGAGATGTSKVFSTLQGR